MGKQYCCICKNHRGKQLGSRTISLHSVPLRKDLRQAWLRRLPLVRKDFSFSKHTRVCSDHFEGLAGPSSEITIPSLFPNKSFRSSSLTDGTDMALTAVKEEDDGANTDDGEDNQTTIHQNRRSFDKLSVFLHDYCGPIPENTISSERNASCQTATLQQCSTSTQTDEGFLQAIYSQDKPSEPQQTNACTQTDFTQTCEHSTQVLLPSLTFADVKTDPELVNFYTGLGDGNTFSCIFDELSEAYERDYPSSKFGRPNSLSLIDQFFMVLMRLRLGLLVVDIANRFHVSRTTCGRTLNRWIDLKYKNLSFLISWPKRDIIDATMPKGFKDIYPQTRVVIDCTEIFIEKPYSVARQSQMYSHYKSHIILKGLIGITPNGVVSCVSDLWSGAISDRQITIESGRLDLCEFGDAVMADKGFMISDLTTPKGLHLIIPPLKRKRKQLTLEEIQKTRRIANLRIHVERHMERVEHFRILQGIIPITISNSVNKIWKICNALTTLLPPLYPHDQDSDTIDVHVLDENA